jgi:hypothetical protein
MDVRECETVDSDYREWASIRNPYRNQDSTAVHLDKPIGFLHVGLNKIEYGPNQKLNVRLPSLLIVSKLSAEIHMHCTYRHERIRFLNSSLLTMYRETNNFVRFDVETMSASVIWYSQSYLIFVANCTGLMYQLIWIRRD